MGVDKKTSNLVYRLMVASDIKSSLKGAWSGSRDSFLHFGAQVISLDRMKLDISSLVCRLHVKSTGITHVKVLQYGGVFRVTWPLKFLGNKW